MTLRVDMQRTTRPYTRLMREHDLELLELPAVLARSFDAAAVLRANDGPAPFSPS